MTEIKGGLTLGLKRNLTLAAGEQQNSVYTDSGDFAKKGSAATICVSVIVSLSLLVLCAFLLYRHLNRRKKQWGTNQKKARRESIKQAVRLRLQELEHIPDSTPWLEQRRTRSASVTFGDVILLNPSDKPMDSPVIDNRKQHGNHLQEQAYHQVHHHSIYNASKQRSHHHPHRPDYPKVNRSQQDREPSLQRHLSVHEDHARDNQIRMYPNGDHHRLSVQTKLEPTTEHNQKALMNSEPIFMNNNEHHRLPASKILEPTPEQGRETCVKPPDRMMHNNEHHRLPASKMLEPTPEQGRETCVKPPDRVVHNNGHHRLSASKMLETKPVKDRETCVKSTDRMMHNNEHHKLSVHKKFGPQTEQVREASMNSANVLMRNNEHHRLSSQKQSQPTSEHVGKAPTNSTHRSQMYRGHNSNRSLVGDANVSERSAPCNSQAVLHNGYSQRKRRSATIPMDGDAAAY